MSGFSKTELFNTALLSVGANRIDSAVSTNPNAVLCEDVYKPARTYLLAQAHWVFARTRQELALVPSAPVGPYSNAFALPSDLISVIPAVGDNRRYVQRNSLDLCWEVQGDYLYTDESNFMLEYIRDIQDGMAMPAYFFEALASELAKRVSNRLNGAQVGALTLKAKQALREAMMLNNREQPAHPRAFYSRLTDLSNR